MQYPAFVDCAMALMQRPASELREEVSGAIWRRLGGALASCVGPMQRILRDGAGQGLFKVEEPDYLANRLCVQMLGSVHLARSGMGVRETAPGVAALFEIDPRRVVDDCVSDALALVGVPGRSARVSGFESKKVALHGRTVAYAQAAAAPCCC